MPRNSLNTHKWHTQMLSKAAQIWHLVTEAPTAPFLSWSTMIRFFDSCSWIRMTFSWPFTIKYPPEKSSQVKSRSGDCEDKLKKFVVVFLIPGSSGHSLSFANSMGVFPVSTQLELRNIIGILQKQNTIKHNKHMLDNFKIYIYIYFKKSCQTRPKHRFYLPIGSALRMILWLPRVYSMSTVMGAE